MRDMQRSKGKSDRCGARTRSGRPCKAKGYGKGGRCKNHGGMSTGARTAEGRAKLAAVVSARWKRWREERRLHQVAKGSDATARVARQVVRIVGRRVMQRLVEPPRPKPQPQPQPQHHTAHDLDFEVSAHPFLTGGYEHGDGPERERYAPPTSSAPMAEHQDQQDFRPLDSGVALDEPDDDYWKS